MVAPTKIIAGLGLSLGIDILEAPGATGDYRTLLTSKATAIAKALSVPLQTPPFIFVPGEDEHKPGRAQGYDFGFLHIKVRLKCLMLSHIKYEKHRIKQEKRSMHTHQNLKGISPYWCQNCLHVREGLTVCYVILFGRQ